MAPPVIRPMLPADVGAATEMVLSHDWGVRRDWLAYAAAAAACSAFIATDAGGRVVATGVGTANGPVGWIGSIFVAPEARGQGLGREITQAIIDALDASGCTTLCLVATADGRRLYERMGFEVQTRYRILEAPGVAGPPGRGTDASRIVRPFAPADLEAMVALDRAATGEDRRHALVAFANPTSTKVLVADGGEVRGFVCRPPWGGGATIAPLVEDAMAIADARRRVAGAGGKVRVGILSENQKGHDRLIAAGWTPSWSAPRMIRGEMPGWRPGWIWGQFNHAMG